MWEFVGVDTHAIERRHAQDQSDRIVRYRPIGLPRVSCRPVTFSHFAPSTPLWHHLDFRRLGQGCGPGSLDGVDFLAVGTTSGTGQSHEDGAQNVI